MRNLAKAAPLRDGGARGGPPARRARAGRHPARTPSSARSPRRSRAEGPIDVLVNNAGIGGATPLELTPEAEHRAMFETNYWGADPDDPGGAAGDARAAGRVHRERHLDRGADRHPEPDRVLRVQARAGRGERGAGPRGARLRDPRRHHRAGRHPDRHLRELGGRHPLRQDLALPADHAPQRQALRGGLPPPGRSPRPSRPRSSTRSPPTGRACAIRSASTRRA